MDTKKITELFNKYNLVSSDYFKHKHYQIITRQGIDKIQAIEKIFIEYEVVIATPEYCGVKAKASKEDAKIETFGSAKYGGKDWLQFDKADQYGKKGKWVENGNTNSWYVLEIAEKRAMSRAVLKLTGFYELGVFGEDESEDFKKETEPAKKKEVKISNIPDKLNACKNLTELASVYNSLTVKEKSSNLKLKDELKLKLSK